MSHNVDIPSELGMMSEILVDSSTEYMIGLVLPRGIDAVLPVVRMVMQRAFDNGAPSVNITISVENKPTLAAAVNLNTMPVALVEELVEMDPAEAVPSVTE